MIPWMAMALMVSTRLWLGGVVSEHRDRKLADQLLKMVKACGLPLSALLVLTDGWSAYPNRIRRTFREKVKRVGTRGRCRLQEWPEIVIGVEIREDRETSGGRASSGVWRKARWNMQRNCWHSPPGASSSIRRSSNASRGRCASDWQASLVARGMLLVGSRVSKQGCGWSAVPTISAGRIMN
jgi:hypothetical protein